MENTQKITVNQAELIAIARLYWRTAKAADRAKRRAAGYTPRPVGRPRKHSAVEAVLQEAV